MENLKSFEEVNESSMTYDKDKLYSYQYIKNRLKGAPAYIKTELKDLVPVKTKSPNGSDMIGVKISERLFAYVFNPRF